jgi:hypothetical protein
MAAKRLTRKLTDVIDEVETQLKAHYGVTKKELAAWRTRARALQYKFPVSTMIAIEQLWIDYEVQRNVLHKHIINIMKKWDPRICSPGSACRIGTDPNVYLYDAQHRTVAAGLLGYTEIPCAVVETKDPNFASYAFEMLNAGTKRLTPGDLHRNALVRYKNNSRDKKVVDARTMQDQFDIAGIDLQDKSSRASDSLRGNNYHFMSHFKYAQKGINIDLSGKVLLEILTAIKDTFPLQEEIDQGCYIGLYELYRISSTSANGQLPAGWMKSVLETIRPTFKSSRLIHDKARVQWEHVNPGATWSAPSAMANFLRELYLRNGGQLKLPYHGKGAKMGIEDGNIAPGLFPEAA